MLLESWKRRPSFGDLSQRKNRRKLARWIFTNKNRRPGRFDTEPEEAIARLADAPPTFGSLIGTCFALYAERHGKQRWGDKRPMYCQYLDTLFAMFPDAQFVNVVRDPRAAVASMRKLDWYGGSVVPAAELWMRSLRALDVWRKRLAPDQLLEIRYEDLVEDPHGTLDRICSFLGLSADGIDTMLDYYEENDVPESKYHWRVSQPVSTTSLRSWERELSRDEIALVERVAGRQRMRRYGYEPVADGARPPAPMRKALRQRRAQIAKRRIAWVWREVKFRFTYRFPVAARLTSGQRR